MDFLLTGDCHPLLQCAITDFFSRPFLKPCCMECFSFCGTKQMLSRNMDFCEMCLACLWLLYAPAPTPMHQDSNAGLCEYPSPAVLRNCPPSCVSCDSLLSGVQTDHIGIFPLQNNQLTPAPCVLWRSDPGLSKRQPLHLN